MPTDPAPAESGPAAADRHKPIRLALGVAAPFLVGMAADWPFAFVGAVFAALFLQAPQAPTWKAGAVLVAYSLGLLAFGYALFSLLLPFEVPFLIVQTLVLIWAFSLSAAGKSPLLVVLALMVALMVPYVTQLSREVAAAMVVWLPVNMAVALIATRAAFAVFPASRSAIRIAAQEERLAPPFDPERRIVRMTLVTVPFVFLFVVSGSGAVLTLLFVAILAQQLAASTESGPSVAKGMLGANVIGGLAAILAYELLVIDTSFAFFVVLTLLMCLGFGRWLTSNRPDAAVAGSALTTMLILLGGAMAPFGDGAEIKMVDRLVQVAAALVWVLSAFVVVDRFLPEREITPKTPSWRGGKTSRPARGRIARPPAHRA